VEMAKSVAQAPGGDQNPFFVCGDVGLGKTHLITAIGNALKGSNGAMRIALTSASRFADDAAAARRTPAQETLRRAYEQCDALIVDDVQFLGGHIEAQEDLFHIFNAMQERGKQIVIAGDRTPDKLGLLEKRDRGEANHRRHLEQTRALLEAGPLDLVVWPETAYTRGLRRPLPLAGAAIRDDLPVPLLFGATSVWESDGRRVSANSAMLVGADGMIREAYDKNWLIPLAEFAPFARWLPGIAGYFPHVQTFRAAREVPPLHLGEWRIATPICYEAVRPTFVRRMVVEARPHFFVTLANDAWFGDSQEPWIHLAMARLRAVEHRLWMVRSTNSGISAVIDPAGRVVARTGLLTAENLRATVHPRAGRTVYGRFGDWPGWAGLSLTLLGFVPRRAR